ncbi:fatty acyl-CoA reductase 3-like [Euphorbia lathyris]|uniref:fatty acyl-CoA reductase 3-like n=1 Tax=Euphorbia lathyris TaxID=212925 RepID=UPI003313C26E
MEFENIVQFLENKAILVTGVTGFLAKVFIEKILRVQPNVKKLYLLLRASDDISASERFHNEVMNMELFRVVKEKLGENLSSIFTKKIKIICGDVGSEDLGIKDSSLKEEMKNELDFVLNFAATTKFDERYDVAFGTNTMGAKNVVCFAKTCPKLKLLVYLSTAYVCGVKSGLIQESPYNLNEPHNGISGLDINEENDLIDKKVEELRAQKVTEAESRDAMKELGMKRAEKYGWPNTYVFTKFMGEMIIQYLKENLPVIIIRPTIISSTYKEPFPGWTEGLRTIDAFIVGVGKGKMKFVAIDLAAIVDVIPVDMVVNAIVVAMVANANKPYSNGIYHVGSSSRNPVRYCDLKDYTYHYFTNKPCLGKNGKPIKFSKPIILNSKARFHRYLAIHYMPLLKGLKLVNRIFCHQFENMYKTLDKKIKFVIRLVDLYSPYLFFHGRFDDSNINKLLKSTKGNGVKIDTFYFDVKCIDWDDYFVNTHIPGLLEYVMV